MRRAWTSSVASQVGRNRGGAGVSASGSGARGRSSSSLPSSSRNRRSSSRSSGGRHVLHVEAGPVGDLGRACGPEPAQVAADDEVAGVRLPDVLRADPVLGRGVQIGSAALPRPGRRHAHEVDEETDTARPLAEQLLDLLPAERTLGERPPELPCSGLQRARVGDPVHAEPPRAPRLADRHGERPVVGLRHEVDRGAEQRRLDDRAPLESTRQRRPLEPVQPAPEADVHRRRVLRLDAADPLERSWDRRPTALEQQLPREQGSVQLKLREDALHRPRT